MKSSHALLPFDRHCLVALKRLPILHHNRYEVPATMIAHLNTAAWLSVRYARFTGSTSTIPLTLCAGPAARALDYGLLDLVRLEKMILAAIASSYVRLGTHDEQNDDANEQ